MKGWLRAIRDALGMTGAQLARRLKLSPARIYRIEQDEVAGRLTIRTMRRVAEALDCVFVYGFVPNTSLQEAVRRKAEAAAREKLSRLSQTMHLEGQDLTDQEKRDVLKKETEHFMTKNPKSLWDET
jgi:predicted DNA-binding mobile mystery protein A